MTLEELSFSLSDAVKDLREMSQRADRQSLNDLTEWGRGFGSGLRQGIQHTLTMLEPFLRDLEGDPENEYEAS